MTSLVERVLYTAAHDFKWQADRCTDDPKHLEWLRERQRDAETAYEVMTTRAMQACAADLLAAMERELKTATPSDAEWLKRNLGVIRKIAAA